MNQMALRKAAELAGSAPVIFFMGATDLAPLAEKSVDEGEDSVLDNLVERVGVFETKLADILEPPVVEETELEPESATEISAEQSSELVSALQAVSEEI
jgi:hypothetical protein